MQAYNLGYGTGDPVYNSFLSELFPNKYYSFIFFPITPDVQRLPSILSEFVEFHISSVARGL